MAHHRLALGAHPSSSNGPSRPRSPDYCPRRKRERCRNQDRPRIPPRATPKSTTFGPIAVAFHRGRRENASGMGRTKMNRSSPPPTSPPPQHNPRQERERPPPGTITPPRPSPQSGVPLLAWHSQIERCAVRSPRQDRHRHDLSGVADCLARYIANALSATLVRISHPRTSPVNRDKIGAANLWA